MVPSPRLGAPGSRENRAASWPRVRNPPTPSPPTPCMRSLRSSKAGQLLPCPEPGTSHPMGLGSQASPCSFRQRGGREVRRRGRELRVQGQGGMLVPTEEAVILPGALHAAVGQDLQVEAGAAVKLPPAQDTVQVRQLHRTRPAASGTPLQRAPPLA